MIVKNFNVPLSTEIQPDFQQGNTIGYVEVILFKTQNIQVFFLFLDSTLEIL